MKKIWIVTAVDSGETCDGKARALAACKTQEEAFAFARADIEKWADDRAGENIEVDFDKLSASYPGTNFGCEWNVEELSPPA